jgi:UDP-3-O-acyl N-acetylglucosamine deacetylase
VISAPIGRPRQTLARHSGRFSGVALHSGQNSWVEVGPADPGTGLVFVENSSQTKIPACPQNVCDTTRCTQIAANGVVVQTIEHVLSALAGLSIDDAVIMFEGDEMPAADGSAKPFVDLILSAGIKTHGDGTGVLPFVITEPQIVRGNEDAHIVVMPAQGFRATVILDYPKYGYLGTQVASYDPSVDNYSSEIAPARTYGFLSELAWLNEHGLALGASAENALVLGDTEYVSQRRFDNEPARHKLLDLIGDLSLVGRPIQGEIFAFKPSHALNVKLAAMLTDGG